jgi:IS30 family transposase
LVSRAIVEGFNPFADRVKTLTYDNGKEFAAHIQIYQALNSTGYFARSFASWELSSNENFNDLLRQYVPKKRLMNTVELAP